MNVIREIGVYEREEKGDSFIKVIELNVNILDLINILGVNKENDPELYMVYKIDRSQYLKLKEIAPELSNFDFDKVEMYYECYKSS